MTTMTTTGRCPFAADTPVALIHQHINAPLPDITTVAPDVPDNIADILLKMMAKKPEERYQSCDDLVRDLQAALAPQAAVAKAVKRTSSAVYVMIGVVIVLALAVAGAGMLWWRRKA